MKLPTVCRPKPEMQVANIEVSHHNITYTLSVFYTGTLNQFRKRFKVKSV